MALVTSPRTLKALTARADQEQLAEEDTQRCHLNLRLHVRIYDKSTTANIRHFGRHNRHELDVGIKRQTSHEQNSIRYFAHVHRRFRIN